MNRYLIEDGVQSATLGINEMPDKTIKDEAKFTSGMPSKFLWDGKKMTSLLVYAALNEKSDFEELIEFLKVHKHCFDK